MRTYLTIIFVLAIGGILMAQQKDLNRQDLLRQIETLQTELTRMAKQIETITGNPSIKRPMPNIDADSDVKTLMVPVNQALADLALAINQIQKRDKPDRPTKTHSRTLTTSDITYHIRPTNGVQSRTVTLTNTGTDLIINPRLIVNNKRNWHSTSDILNEILTPTMTDREKALSIWQFLVDNRYHDQPAHNDIETHDPVRFLNVYGYGFCDDSATNFMVLAERAGLKSRVWGLSGHVVPEAHFDGDWHMLDPDGEIYYLDDDGQNISSIQTLQKRPDIIRKYPSPYYTDAEKLVEIYTTTHDNYISEWYRKTSESNHTLSFILRPGESLIRSHANWGRYFASRYLSEPKHYGNGTFSFQPIFENDIYKKGATSVRNLKTQQNTLLNTTRTGTLIYPFKSPYPYLDGKIQIIGSGTISLAFSEDQETWHDIWQTNSNRTVNTTIPIGGYFRNGHGRPTYTYAIKLILNGTISKLKFESDIQVAPQSLPVLHAGNNTVHYIDDTKGERRMRIAFGYDIKR